MSRKNRAKVKKRKYEPQPPTWGWAISPISDHPPRIEPPYRSLPIEPPERLEKRVRVPKATRPKVKKITIQRNPLPKPVKNKVIVLRKKRKMRVRT